MPSGSYSKHIWEEHTGSASDKCGWLNHAETQYEEAIQYMTDLAHDFYTIAEADARYARTPSHPSGRSDPDSLDADYVDGYTKAQILAGAFPSGAIVMFGSGTIPDMFEECDGSGGNPNLQDFIPKGAGGGDDPGDYGGSNSITPTASSFTSPDCTLSDNQIPRHTHDYSETACQTTGGFGNPTGRLPRVFAANRSTYNIMPGNYTTRTAHNHTGCTISWTGYNDEDDEYVSGALDIRPACRGVRFLVRK